MKPYYVARESGNYRRRTAGLVNDCAEMLERNGGPLLRFTRDDGSLTYALPCGYKLYRSTLYAMQRRGIIRRVSEPRFIRRRETWAIHVPALERLQSEEAKGA